MLRQLAQEAAPSSVTADNAEAGSSPFERLRARSSVSVIECEGHPVGTLWIDDWSPHVLVTALHMRAGWQHRRIQASVIARVVEQARVVGSDVEIVVAAQDVETLAACDRLGFTPNRVESAAVHMLWRAK